MPRSEADKNNNYYAVLGVQRGAAPSEIRTHYRRLMQQAGNHPDLGGDTNKAALINKAYAVLRDPLSRREHDSRLDILELVAGGIVMTTPQKTFDPTVACLFCEQSHDYGSNDLADISCTNCGSTLQPVDSVRTEPTGQRSMQRLDREVNMTLFAHWQQKKGIAAKTGDISLQGLRMMAPCQLQLGQRVRLASRMFDAVGEISHCEPDRSGWREATIAGVAFLTLRFHRSAGVFVSRQA